MAENSNGKFRGSLFGGFNRKDVAVYIGKVGKETNEYKEECAKLKEENRELKSKVDELTRQISELSAQNEELNGEVETLRVKCEEQDRLKETVAAMQARIDSDAETIAGYEKMKDKLSELEVEALKRAQQIETRAMSEYERIMNRVGE